MSAAALRKSILLSDSDYVQLKGKNTGFTAIKILEKKDCFSNNNDDNIDLVAELTNQDLNDIQEDTEETSTKAKPPKHIRGVGDLRKSAFSVIQKLHSKQRLKQLKRKVILKRLKQLSEPVVDVPLAKQILQFTRKPELSLQEWKIRSNPPPSCFSEKDFQAFEEDQLSD